MIRHFAPLLFAIACAACTPQQALVSALIPDGTASMLLSHLQGVQDANRQRIAELESRKDWPALAKFADDNIVKDAFSPEWRLIGGYAHTQLGDHHRAAAYYREMVRLAPDEAAGYHFLAESQRASGEPARAVATLERALLVIRDSPLTHHLLGEALSDLSRPLQAVAAYRNALKMDPMLAQAWFGLGRASLRLGRENDAQEALAALTRLDPAMADRLQERFERKTEQKTVLPKSADAPKR